MEKAKWDAELMCDLHHAKVHGTTVEFFVYPGQCVDMRGAIDKAKRMTPQVTKVRTYSGLFTDTVYRKSGSDWRADSTFEGGP